MKAITPIIGTVLIIIIAIGVFAAVIFVMTSSINAGSIMQESREKELENKGKVVRINFLNLTENSIEVVNIGNKEINISEIKIYVDNELTKCTWDKQKIDILGKAKCIFIGSCKNKVEIVSPGGKDFEIC